MNDYNELSNDELNRETLIALGWRWEPKPSANDGGNLYRPDGTRYGWYISEPQAWRKAPQVATSWSAAGEMLTEHRWNVIRVPEDDNYIVNIYEFFGINNHKATAGTFPRAACIALLRMLEKREGVPNES